MPKQHSKPNEIEALIDEAYTAYEDGDFDAALQACDLALKRVPQEAELHNLRGLVLDALGYWEKAITAYKEAVRLEPDFSEAWENLKEAERDLPIRPQLDAAYDHEEAGELDAALAACDEVLKVRPEMAEAHNLRGMILDGLGRLQEALAAYQEAVRLDPDFADAWANLEDVQAEIDNKK